jgi:Ca-activated chloride channel family protein
MTFTPMLPLVVLIPVAVLLLGFVIWQLSAARGTPLAKNWIARLGLVVLVLMLSLRPAIAGAEAGSTAEGGLEVYFVVDTTSSMAAEDFESGPRLDGVKADIGGIARSLPGAEFALVTFDSSAVQRMPLTGDLSALRSAVTSITQEVTTYSSGSSIDEPLDLVTRVLTEAAEDYPDRPRLIYYFGDGEQTVAEEPVSFDTLAPLIDGGAVLGYGTEQGGRMLSFDGYNDANSEPGYILDRSTDPAQEAISRIDEARLGAIAEQLGVPYVLRNYGDPVDPLVAGITVAQPSINSEPAGAATELYWWFAIPIVLLLLRELLGTTAALNELRTPRMLRTPRTRRTRREESS